MRVCKHYGCVAAAYAQASGMQLFMQPGPDDSKLLSSISVCTFDDSSMWMKDPAMLAERQSGARSEGMKLKNGTVWRRGKNICLPVYNQTEVVVIRRQHEVHNHCEQVLRCATVHSPAQVLPMANTGTVANRRKRWNACGIGEPGTYFNAGDTFQDTAGSAAWHTVIPTSDNLVSMTVSLG